ncbi:hypothetical protein AAGG74_16355 [Bacillus mexicanus]|uniref:beta barrel domain-containing protein n=1 Tax=Bacillus mexicanus TaxID=2834415 RepID=UPI003D24A63F
MNTLKLLKVQIEQIVYVMPLSWGKEYEPIKYIVTKIDETGIYARPFETLGNEKQFDKDTFAYKGLFDDYKMFLNKEEYIEFSNKKVFEREFNQCNDDRKKIREDIQEILKGINTEELSNLLGAIR